MNLILTNDDGIDAPGIRALNAAVDNQGIFVAPQGQLSGCGHQVTTLQPLQVETRSLAEYAVAGTPADCARVAITQFDQIDWLLSGINAGGNLGIDVYTSGTVAAVREAAMHGVKGIALSHWIKRPLTIDWQIATAWTERVLAELWQHSLPRGHFWNVNLPHLEPGAPEPEIVFCEPSIEPLPVRYRLEGDLYYYEGEYSQRERAPGTDVDICFSGQIAVTQLSL
jgi:5'-nucleotidase